MISDPSIKTEEAISTAKELSVDEVKHPDVMAIISLGTDDIKREDKTGDRNSCVGTIAGDNF